jgi:hypothetical protein
VIGVAQHAALAAIGVGIVTEILRLGCKAGPGYFYGAIHGRLLRLKARGWRREWKVKAILDTHTPAFYVSAVNKGVVSPLFL